MILMRVCNCDDMAWLTQAFVDGELVDEQLVDCNDPDVGNASMAEISKIHRKVYSDATNTGRTARLKVFCPKCGGGYLFDSELGAKNIPSGGKPSMLHILGRATPADQTSSRGPVFTATCGHACVATPETHQRLKDTDFMHVSYCLMCFASETD